MESRALLLGCIVSIGACGRKSGTTIKPDPSAKNIPSSAPSRSEAVAIYRLVLQDQFGPYRDAARIRVIDRTVTPSCGTPAQIASSMPTAHAETIAAFGRIPDDHQLLTPLADALELDLLPHLDALHLQIEGGPDWPQMGLVAFSAVAFDSSGSDALVSYVQIPTPIPAHSAPLVPIVIHLVRRQGTWFEQEILRCP
jgi:hypothetical protein